MMISRLRAAVFLAASGLLFAGTFSTVQAQVLESPPEKPVPKARRVAALLQVFREVGLTGAKGTMSDKEFERFKRTQIVLIQSPVVLEPTLKRKEVADLKIIKEQEDPLGWLEDHLQVEYPKDTDILRIGIQGQDKRELAILVKAVTEVYLKEIANKNQNPRQKRLELLQAIHSELTHGVQSKGETMVALVKALGVPDAKQAALHRDLAMRGLNGVQQELGRIKLARVAAEAKLERNKAEKNVNQAKQKALIADLEKEIADLSTHEKRLEHLADGLAEKASATDVGTKEIEDLRQELQALETQKNELNQQIETLRMDLHAVPRIEVLYLPEVPEAK